MEEIELKLALSPRDVAAFRRSGPLAGQRPRRRKLTTIYFDTPDCELARAGMALRLRKSGGRWTQTLKGGPGGTGGFHARSEWEAARPDATIDLTTLPATALDGVSGGAAVGERLEAAFTVDVQRETWELEPTPGTRLEVALDRGQAQARGRADEVCEVEIELLGGDPKGAFDLAHAFLETVLLRPSAVTKAQRGYRLLRNEGLQPAKAAPVALEDAMTVDAAARAVAAAALDQLQGNEEGVLSTTDPEFVHQARVGLRRLRSALRIFRDAVPAEAAQWREELGNVAREMGQARDWDVFAAESFPPLAKAFGNPAATDVVARRAAARRRKAREAARAALRSATYARLILDISRWLSGGTPTPPAESTVTLEDFARRLVRKRHRKLVADARELAQRSAEERHAVRIDAKRLRYAIDGFAVLFKGKAVRRYQAALSDLQDLLGAANDAVTGTQLLAQLAPSAALTEFARGWFAGRTEADPAKAGALVERLEHTTPFKHVKN